MPDTERPTRRRPKDRKEQILEQASRLFIERGFPSVTMEDIADAAGITSRALYRHYDNKRSLLATVIAASQDRYLSARADRVSDRAGPRSLTAELPALADIALATRNLTVLWQREARYLTQEERRQVRHRLNTIVAGIHDNIATERPELSGPHVELRAWGVSSTLTSLGLHNLTLPGDELPALLYRAASAAARTAPLARLHPAEDAGHARPTPESRRERILHAAAATFSTHGFPPVTTNEIARQAGIAGPGIYRYFPSKQAILDTLAQRHDEWLALEHLRALRRDTKPDDQLRALVEGYTRLGTETPNLITLTTIESSHLTPATSDTVTRNRNDRETAWINRIREARPDTGKAQARILVRAATSFIDDTVRTPRLWKHDGVSQEITEIALSILLA